MPQQLIVNQVYPEHFPAGPPVAQVLDALIAATRRYRRRSPRSPRTRSLSRDRRALNARYLGELRARAKTPVVQLPMLFAPALGAGHPGARRDARRDCC